MSETVLFLSLWQLHSLTVAYDFMAILQVLVIVGLIIVSLVLALLRLFLMLAIIVGSIFLTEATIQVLFVAAATTLFCGLGATRLSWIGDRASLTPAASGLSSIHLREEQAKHSLTIGPIQIVQLDCDLLLWHGRWVLALIVLLWEFAARLDQRQELWLLVRSLCCDLSFHLSTLFFFDLLHRFKEELLDVGTLVQDHLTYLLQTWSFSVLLPNRLVQIVKLFMLLANDLLILELQ